MSTPYRTKPLYHCLSSFLSTVAVVSHIQFRYGHVRLQTDAHRVLRSSSVICSWLSFDCDLPMAVRVQRCVLVLRAVFRYRRRRQSSLVSNQILSCLCFVCTAGAQDPPFLQRLGQFCHGFATTKKAWSEQLERSLYRQKKQKQATGILNAVDFMYWVYNNL